MKKDALFRGCTRPPMFMGVPYLPFFAGAGTCLLMTMYFNMFLIVLLPVVVFTMRQMARRDELIFRLLMLRFQMNARMRNVRAHDGLWVFTPNHYRNSRAKFRR